MILGRIKEYIDFKGITVAAFERSIGMSNASFGKSLRNNGAIGTDKLENILSVYEDISPNWLLTGEGSMLKGEDDTNKEEPKMLESQSLPANIGAPYYDVDFLGGFAELGNDQTTTPATRVYIQGFERADLWCNVTGHSMEPKISHGDIIGLHRCTIDDVQYGETYAVVMDDIRTVKILRRASSPDMFLFVPVNKEEYDEQEFPKSRITLIYEVIAAVKKFF